MAKIDELLQELCPEGVEWKTLGEVAEIGTGSSNTKDGLSQGLYPFYTRGKDILWKNEYEFDEEAVITAGDGNVGKIIHYATGKYALHQRAYRFSPKEALLCKFLFYYMQVSFYQYICGQSVSSSVSSLRKPKLMVYPIPLPSIKMQQEIVEFLDTFTDAISNLEEELALREKQFEYYREQLFNFDEGEYEWKCLPDISINCDKQRKAVSSKNRNSGIYPYYGASGVVDHVNDYIFDGEYLLISEDGANLCTRVYPIAFSIKGKNWVNNHAHVIKFDNYVLQKFTEIYLNSLDLRPWISTGAQPKLNQDNLNKIRIPVPSLDRQQEIVEILDTFEAMIANIKEEIALRTKQYEYYREKLLSFGK